MRETRVDKSLMNRPFIVEMYLRLSPRAIGVGGSEPDPFFGVLLACFLRASCVLLAGFSRAKDRQGDA